MKKKRVNRTDLTLRNLRAMKKRLGEQDARIYALEQDVKMLGSLVMGIVKKPKRSKPK